MSSRLEYLARTQAAALLRGLERENEAARALYRADALAHVRKLAEGDPTPKGRYVQAIVRWHGQGLLLLEDLYKVRSDLETFERVKGRLPPEQRDPLRLASPHALYDIVQPHLGTLQSVSRRTARAEHSREIRAQTDILYEGEDGLVVIPRTVEASRYWGRGTRWCTAATDTDWFAGYSRRGPLVVVACADGAKFQYQAATRSVMDATDRQVNAGALLKQAPFVAASEAALAHLWAAAPSETAQAVRQTPELCLAAVRLNGLVLETVANKTDGLCREACKQNGDALRFVPVQNFSLFQSAVRHQPAALGLLSPVVQGRYPELCREALRREPQVLHHLAWSVQMENPDLCLEAVRRNGQALEYVKYPDYELCRAAVEKDGLALKWVPRAIKEAHPGLLLQAVRQNPKALGLIASPGPEVYLEAVRRDGLILAQIKQQTLELCRAAVRQNGLALAFVHKQTEELCLDAVQQSGEALKYVALQTRALCIAAVRGNPAMLRYVQNVTREIWAAAYSPSG